MRRQPRFATGDMARVGAMEVYATYPDGRNTNARWLESNAGMMNRHLIGLPEPAIVRARLVAWIAANIRHPISLLHEHCRSEGVEAPLPEGGGASGEGSASDHEA